jgi:predicted TIM-barrel fold metal-dependent hydrolase
VRIDDMILISIDDHVVEPPDMFDHHVPAAYADRAPKIVADGGIDRWVFQGAVAGSMGLNAVVSWPKDEWGMDPTTFAEMRPGAYDIHERVRDMNRNGVLASMCFPTFAGFSAGTFQQAQDKDLALVMLRAYNDWHIDEWCTAYPGRFIPLALCPVWDPGDMVDEVHRVAAKGCRAVSMPELPHLQGLPSYHSDWWDPFFAAVCDEAMVMCLHIGQGFAAITNAPDAPIDNLIILATQVSALAAQDLLWGPAFRKYPELKVAWSEAGIGWIPFYLDRCDRHFQNQKWLHHDFGGRLPSEVFRQHSLACYVTDPAALKLRHEIGIESIAWECDYPHSDSLWPDAPEVVLAELEAAGASDSDIDHITWANTCRFFDHDAFATIPRSEATVGALRRGMDGVDVATVPRAEWRRRYEAVHGRAS